MSEPLQLRSFPFTFNLRNPDGTKWFLCDDEDTFLQLCTEVENLVESWGGYKSITIGYELGKTPDEDGLLNPHLQGYIMLKKRKASSILKNPEGRFHSWHIEERQWSSAAKNSNYCKKEKR